MITTTLNRIRSHNPCADGWKKLLAGLGKTAADDEPIPFALILETNGLDDALWCCRAEPQYATEWRMFAVWCARQVQHLMTDPRSIAALDVAERYANGQATEEELRKARVAAWAAAEAAREARVAAWAAAEAAREAWAAAGAAWAAVWAVGAAAGAAEVARAEARDEMRAKQASEFLRIVTETEARA